VIAGVTLRRRAGDRANDRHRDVDNGTRVTVTAIDNNTGALTVTLGGGGVREIDADYAAGHLEHAYALTGHGAQGGPVDWAAVIGRPSDFTAEWAYTALSRARGQTPHARGRRTRRPAGRTPGLRPLEPAATLGEALRATCHAIRRHIAEPLALRQITSEQPTSRHAAHVPQRNRGGRCRTRRDRSARARLACPHPPRRQRPSSNSRR